MRIRFAGMLRNYLERFSRNIVLRRRLPFRFGGDVILVSPGVALKFWGLRMEKVDPVLFNNASELVKPGDVIWDVGSSVGLFSFASAFVAGPSGKVFCIEGDNWSANLLRKSSKMVSNNRASINILSVAVSDTLGIGEFMITKRGRAANFLKGAGGSKKTDRVFETELVITVTLDWLLKRLPAPNVLKIDVEGAEEKVLGGGARVLSTIRPRIFIEVFPQNNVEVTKILKEFHYTLYNAEIDPDKRKPLESAAYNTIAYPYL